MFQYSMEPQATARIHLLPFNCTPLHTTPMFLSNFKNIHILPESLSSILLVFIGAEKSTKFNQNCSVIEMIIFQVLASPLQNWTKSSKLFHLIKNESEKNDRYLIYILNEFVYGKILRNKFNFAFQSNNNKTTTFLSQIIYVKQICPKKIKMGLQFKCSYFYYIMKIL